MIGTLTVKKTVLTIIAFALPYIGLVAAETTMSDSWNVAITKIAEHGILAMLVAALMWMNWLRENRLAAESTRREDITRTEYNKQLETANSHAQELQKFIRDQLMTLINQTHQNIHSCHVFRGEAMEVLNSIEQAKKPPT